MRILLNLINNPRMLWLGLPASNLTSIRARSFEEGCMFGDSDGVYNYNSFE